MPKAEAILQPTAGKANSNSAATTQRQAVRQARVVHLFSARSLLSLHTVRYCKIWNTLAKSSVQSGILTALVFTALAAWLMAGELMISSLRVSKIQVEA